MKFYEDNYPVIEASGYGLIDHFPLPSESWWTDYYGPTERTLGEMRLKYQGNGEAQKIFDSFQLEIDMHKKYSKHYGYCFYIMRRTM